MVLQPVRQQRFKRDVYLRRRVFDERSFEHQAKTNLYQLGWLVGRHVPAGGRVLDSMGGTGSTLYAASLGCDVVVGEIEEHWLEILKANRRLLAGRLKAQLFGGRTLAYQGDALKLPFGAGAFNAVVTSPPYWDTFSDWHISSRCLQRRETALGPAFGDDRGRRGRERNLGNIHVYENYLAAMGRVYAEYKRVLAPGGKLILVVKDRIHKKRLVPIVRDTAALCVAMGFSLVDWIECPTTGSLYRNVYRQTNPDGPRIETESLLVFETPNNRQPAKRCLALVEVGRLALHRKQLAYARAQTSAVVELTLPLLPKARARRAWCFHQVADLVLKDGLRGGHETILLLPARFAKYAATRLSTFGCAVATPLARLNHGQKLAWLTERGF